MTSTHAVSVAFLAGRWRFDWHCSCGASGVGRANQELEHLSLEGSPIETPAHHTGEHRHG